MLCFRLCDFRTPNRPQLKGDTSEQFERRRTQWHWVHPQNGLRVTVLSAMLTVLFFAATASAVQYSYLDPNYVQEIYTGPLVGGPGMAWTSNDNLLTRNGSDILEYSLTQNAVHQGTSIHGYITHTIIRAQYDRLRYDQRARRIHLHNHRQWPAAVRSQ